MLLGGEKIDGPRMETVVIPFGSRQLVFKAKLVNDFSEFDKLCPAPMPATIIKPGGVKIPDLKHPEYLAQVREHANCRSDWLFLKSLEATENLTWETVDMSKPETWKNIHTELDATGFSFAEVNRLMQLVLDANGLDQSKIDEATQRFLTEEAERKEQSSRIVAGLSTPSGEAANA